MDPHSVPPDFMEALEVINVPLSLPLSLFPSWWVVFCKVLQSGFHVFL